MQGRFGQLAVEHVRGGGHRVRVAGWTGLDERSSSRAALQERFGPQVFATDDDRARFVWIADLLPNDDELVGLTGELMQQGTLVVEKTLESETTVGSE